MEAWRDIKEYEGYYQVSDCGNVRSVTRAIPHKKNGVRIRKGQALKPFKNNGKNGRYDLRIALTKDGNRKKYLVARLVAQAFIPNPHNKATINHTDENTLNNHVDNLNWTTNLENIQYGTGIQRRTKTQKYICPLCKFVKQFTTSNVFIRVWRSCQDAERKLGISGISNVARGNRETAGGYKWEYLI